MSDQVEPSSDRQRRLARIRAEVLAALTAGGVVDVAAWRQAHPDLEPELSTLIAALLRDHETLAAGPLGTQAMEPDPGGRTMTLAPTRHDGAVPPRPPVEETQLQTRGTERTEPAFHTATFNSDFGTSGAGGPTLPAHEGTAALDPSAQTAAPGGGGGGGDGGFIATNAGGDSDGPAPGQRVRYVGDYELTRELGRGGMGIVYKARQVSLNRPVALKMIRNAEFASDDQLRRFQNEAEAVATLDHPGIVPIYEVGEYKDLRYFSMKLIEGAALDKQLASFAADPPRAARLVAAIAEAVNHAHQRGILHRDLKPANILIDDAGNPHVTDFGLAKRIEGDAGLTVSGAIMGTPSFMAPEQALGRTREITTATDIYGLGAILYAVLTGQAPFRGDSVLETLERVRQFAPAPPRSHNTKLPQDLEVICLKCLEKTPKQRYGSAQELADDLHRWIRHEPIRARPVGRVTRLRMWCRRNPALATLSVALVAASLVGVAGITVAWREAVAQRGRAEVARDDAVREGQAARKAEGEARTARDAAVASEKAAQAARAQAESNAMLATAQANLALQTIQDLLSRVQNITDPSLVDLKADITRAALARVDQVSNTFNTQGTSKEATTAAALTELAKIYTELGQTERAFRLFQRCNAIYRERIKIKNRNDASRFNLAMNLRELATASAEYQRDLKAVLAYNVESLAILEEILKEPRTPSPGDIALNPKLARELVAEGYQRVGVVHQTQGDMLQARENYLKAVNVRRGLVNDAPKDLAARRNLSFSLLALAETAFRLGDAEAATLYKQAVDLRRELAREPTKNVDVTFSLRGDLAAVLFMMGWFELRSGRVAEARDLLEESKTLRAELVAREPRNAVNQRALGMSCYDLGVVYDRLRDAARSRANFDECRAIRQKLADSSPENDRRQMELMLILARTGRADQAVKIADRLAAGPKLDNELRIDLARAYVLAANDVAKAQPDRSRTLENHALDLLRAALKEGHRDRVMVDTEADFDAIRPRDEFQAILRDLKGR